MSGTMTGEGFSDHVLQLPESTQEEFLTQAARDTCETLRSLGGHANGTEVALQNRLRQATEEMCSDTNEMYDIGEAAGTPFFDFPATHR